MKRVSALLPKRKIFSFPKQQQFKTFATASPSTSASFLNDESASGQQFKVQRLPQKHVEKWLDFETIAHAPLGLPRTHFSNRWWDDPSRDPNAVFVIYDPQQPKNIISALRVYDRHMYFDKQKVKFGGIGHVATHPQFQAKGLATSLLIEASKYMEEERYEVSGVLSTNDDLYESLGWKEIPLEFTQVRGALYTQTYVNRQYKHISRPNWGDESLAKQFCDLYNDYNLHYGFNGTLARDNPEYWMHWVAKGAYAIHGYPLIMTHKHGSLRAFFIASCLPFHQVPFTVESLGGQKIQYSPTHHHVGSFFEFLVNVQEFVIAKEDHDNAMEIFLEFLHALIHKIPALEQTTKREIFFNINIHSPIAEQVLKLDKEHCTKAPFMVEHTHKKLEHGSRYKLLSHGAGSVSRSIFEQDMRHNHLFFKTDEF